MPHHVAHRYNDLNILELQLHPGRGVRMFLHEIGRCRYRLTGRLNSAVWGMARCDCRLDDVRTGSHHPEDVGRVLLEAYTRLQHGIAKARARPTAWHN
jgi:hypothetical protein